MLIPVVGQFHGTASHRSSTTKDTKYHEGFNLRLSFVNLRVLCGSCFSKLTHYLPVVGPFHDTVSTGHQPQRTRSITKASI